MANLNKVFIIGNLTRDPELRYTPKGTAVADIGIAINRYWAGDNGERREEATYVDVTLWSKQAELANQYLSKGKGVFIEGRLQMDSWEDKTTGQKRSKLKIVGESMQFVGQGGSGKGGGPPSSGGGGRDEGYGGGGESQATQPSQSRPSVAQDFQDEEDDIPF